MGGDRLPARRPIAGALSGGLSLLVKLPFATRPWALPVLIAVYRPPAWDRVPGTRHTTPAHSARLLRARLVRWFPARQCIVVGDSGDGTSETARFCRQPRQPRTVVRTFSGEAAWYEPPPPRMRRTMGRPRVKGQHLASPPEGVATTVNRSRLTVAWDGGSTRDMEGVTGTGHWYRLGADLVEGRWGYVHDGPGPHRDEDCLTTALTMQPPQLVAWSTQRWSSATTCQEGRDDLKLEATKSDGQQTVLRFTPCVFGR
jgi:hypothetical protein